MNQEVINKLIAIHDTGPWVDIDIDFQGHRYTCEHAGIIGVDQVESTVKIVYLDALGCSQVKEHVRFDSIIDIRINKSELAKYATAFTLDDINEIARLIKQNPTTCAIDKYRKQHLESAVSKLKEDIVELINEAAADGVAMITDDLVNGATSDEDAMVVDTIFSDPEQIEDIKEAIYNMIAKEIIGKSW